MGNTEVDEKSLAGLKFKQAIHILKTYFKDDRRIRFEKALCLKAILSCFRLYFNEIHARKETELNEMQKLEGSLGIEIIGVGRAPYGMRFRGLAVIDLRDDPRAGDELYIVRWTCLTDYRKKKGVRILPY